MLTRSLCRGSRVNQRAMAQRWPLVTALTPWGFSEPEEKPTARPHWGCTSACKGEAGRDLLHQVGQGGKSAPDSH